MSLLHQDLQQLAQQCVLRLPVELFRQAGESKRQCPRSQISDLTKLDARWNVVAIEELSRVGPELCGQLGELLRCWAVGAGLPVSNRLRLDLEYRCDVSLRLAGGDAGRFQAAPECCRGRVDLLLSHPQRVGRGGVAFSTYD